MSKKVHSIWIFQTRQGQPYIKEDGTANGFDSIWQRFMNKVLSQTNVQNKFTEHDLRAKVASDTDENHALQLLRHSNLNTTNRIYRRKSRLENH